MELKLRFLHGFDARPSLEDMSVTVGLRVEGRDCAGAGIAESIEPARPASCRAGSFGVWNTKQDVFGTCGHRHRRTSRRLESRSCFALASAIYCAGVAHPKSCASCALTSFPSSRTNFSMGIVYAAPLRVNAEAILYQIQTGNPMVVQYLDQIFLSYRYPR